MHDLLLACEVKWFISVFLFICFS